MSFISHAQNFEDVMLWRALRHIEHGFYVDVGANDPDVHSVTKAFYQRGWRGINVEPVQQWFDRLQSARRNDINVQVAAGAALGELLLYEIPDTGLSTGVLEIADRHENERGYARSENTVKVETLTEICLRFHVAPIHFLKIDVEGAEKTVLEGLDLGVIRPWIILVESTLPLSQAESHAEWEPILESNDYTFAYFDGLNRFYVAREHSELLAHFSTPPNVFDDFVSAAQACAERTGLAASDRAQAAQDRSERLEQRMQVGEMRAEAQQQRAIAAEQRAGAAEQRALAAEEASSRHRMRAIAAENYVEALLSSRCWRYTAPIRYAIDRLRKEPISTTTPAAGLSTNSQGSQRPHNESASSRMLPRGPLAAGPVPLTPRARAIDGELRAAIARHQKSSG